MRPNQRFIAGAVCPQCQSIDSLLLDSDDQNIECVDCNYVQSAEQRDSALEQQNEDDESLRQSALGKAIPDKVKVSDIIRITNIKEKDQ